MLFFLWYAAARCDGGARHSATSGTAQRNSCSRSSTTRSVGVRRCLRAQERVGGSFFSKRVLSLFLREEESLLFALCAPPSPRRRGAKRRSACARGRPRPKRVAFSAWTSTATPRLASSRRGARRGAGRESRRPPPRGRRGPRRSKPLEASRGRDDAAAPRAKYRPRTRKPPWTPGARTSPRDAGAHARRSLQAHLLLTGFFDAQKTTRGASPPLDTKSKARKLVLSLSLSLSLSLFLSEVSAHARGFMYSKWRAEMSRMCVSSSSQERRCDRRAQRQTRRRALREDARAARPRELVPVGRRSARRALPLRRELCAHRPPTRAKKSSPPSLDLPRRQAPQGALVITDATRWRQKERSFASNKYILKYAAQ